MKRLRLFVGTLTAAAIITALMPAGFARPAGAIECSPQDDICQALVEAKNHQKDAQSRLAEIQNQIADLEGRMRALSALIGQLNSEIHAQEAAIAITEGQVAELDRQIRFSEADVLRQEAHLDVRRQLFGRRVRALDKHGEVNYLELALSATSFNQLVDRLSAAQSIVRSDHRTLDDLKAEQLHIDALRQDQTVARGKQADLLAKQRVQRDQLDATRASQASALAYSEQLDHQYRAERQSLEQQIAQISDQVKQLQQAYDDEAKKAGGGTGQFVWPLSPHELSQGFGCSPYYYEVYAANCPPPHRMHTGVDIAEPPGSAIFAADTGVITVYYTNYGYGIYAIITHGNGYTTVYGHMQGFVAGIQSGQVVRRGQQIGFEGSSGNSTGPHCHFEIRYNDVYQNPCAFLGGC